MPVTLATHAMGTRFELILDGDDPQRLQAAGEAALRVIREGHARYNLFEPGSWLNHLNRRAAQEPVTLDRDTFDLLKICADVHRDSAGAFDVTVAPLMRAWGLHGSHGSADQSEIQRARDSVGMQYVHLDYATRTVRFDRPGITLDLGGIAKGFAIDQAINLLRELDVSCALLHGGASTVAALGAPPDESAWRIALNTPHNDHNHNTRPVVRLNNQALSVSAPHGRTLESNGQTLGHVMDPRTGRPATCGPFAAAIGDSACLTDAWATALLVLGHTPDTMPDTLHAILPDTLNAAPSPWEMMHT